MVTRQGVYSALMVLLAVLLMLLLVTFSITLQRSNPYTLTTSPTYPTNTVDPEYYTPTREVDAVLPTLALTYPSTPEG